jgi:predicted DNA-binding transcriptional regulator AlpA
MPLFLETLWGLLSALGTLLGIVILGVVTNAIWEYIRDKQLPKVSAYWAERVEWRKGEFDANVESRAFSALFGREEIDEQGLCH